MLINWLAGSFVAVLGTLGILLSWFARRIVTQLDDIAKQNVGLKEQSTSLRELMNTEIHRIDLRLTKLEDWREGLIAGSQLRS